MRSGRTATWTSGEPVSFAPVAYWAITSFLRSKVTDIGSVPVIMATPSWAWPIVENSKRPQFPVRHEGKRHRLTLGRGEQDRKALKVCSRFRLPLHQMREMWRAGEGGASGEKTDRA